MALILYAVYVVNGVLKVTQARDSIAMITVRTSVDYEFERLTLYTPGVLGRSNPHLARVGSMGSPLVDHSHSFRL